jgi:ABC-2 type transport system permease protein
MNDIELTLRQVRYTNRSFFRNPASAFFTFAFPLMFLVIFTALFGGTTTFMLNGVPTKVQTSTYYIPAIATFSIITATYTNLAISVTFLREAGTLKRIRGTPMPAGAYLGARIIQAVLVAILLVIIVTVWGAAFYQAHVTTRTLPAFSVTVILGAACFSALGLALTTVIPNADAAPAVVNASILPLLFLSGVFIALPSETTWYVALAKVFPVYHFARAMLAAFFLPRGTGFETWDLVVMGIWGLAGLAFAVWKFSWEPRSGH